MTTNNVDKYYSALQNALVWLLRKDTKTVTFYDYPEDWPRFHNACSDPCDMLIGPCACGAWHHLKDWQPGSNFAQRLEIQNYEKWQHI